MSSLPKHSVQHAERWEKERAPRPELGSSSVYLKAVAQPEPQGSEAHSDDNDVFPRVPKGNLEGKAGRKIAADGRAVRARNRHSLAL